MKSHLSLLLAACLLPACGSTDFGGSSGGSKSPKDGANVEESKGEKSSSSNEKGSASLTKEERAISSCLAKWGNHPFSDADIANYRKITAAVSVLGSSKVIVDDQVTSEPALILVVAGVNVLGTPEYDFLNPNGYYCLMVGVNVQTDLKINVHCKARLADSQVNVSVLSESEPSASVGVDVLSKVDINRVGNDCG